MKNEIAQLKAENEKLKNQLKAQNDEAEYLSSWLVEFAKLEGKELTEEEIFDDLTLGEVCFNLENRLEVDEANIEILENKIKILNRDIETLKSI